MMAMVVAAEDCSSGGRRKRKPGSESAAAAAEELRLPASAMLYAAATTAPSACSASSGSCDAAQALSPVGPEEFFLSPGDARAAAMVPDGDGCRVLQWKPHESLQLLKGMPGVIGQPSRQDFLAEASARGLDGFFSAGSPQLVVLLRPDEQVALIDDDKRDGLKQELLTDMFTRISLR
mmetsp:Transcript_108982/g.222511  ORF Transcript_108982/g.222511 Transcript_108982/m.222511 type:complete len:178 (+) Transcript_108982:52-585(+)